MKAHPLVKTLAVGMLLVGLLTTSNPNQANAAAAVNCGNQPNNNAGLRVGRISLSGEQVGNARLLMGIASRRRLPRQAAEVAIIASLQAASLKNLSSGGLFQQSRRYYPGVEVTAPAAATNAFYDRMRQVRRWNSRPAGQVARDTQNARNLQTFKKWETAARTLTTRWWGNRSNPTSCVVRGVSTRGNTSKKAAPRTSTPRRAAVPSIQQTNNRNLVRVGGITVSKSIGRNVQQLLAAAADDGIQLRGTGWRSPNRQIALRKRNCGTTTFAIYRKSPSLCRPPTARPGTSNHERGLAVDFRNCSTRTTACYKWLRRNARQFGLKNFPPEPWHWSTNGR